MSGRWYSDITQIAWACEQLLKGKIISHRDEIAAVNGWRLSAIIHQLRHRFGWNIKTDYDGKRIGHYQLAKGTDIKTLELPPSYCAYLAKRTPKSDK